MILTLDEAIQLAITEALKGAPFVSPNPKVGCVILNSDGKLLSKGHHAKYGFDHAEIEALKGLTSEQLKGAHVIVTLEPCAHEGKTPSCAKKLAQLPIAKVTYGLVDPNPLVAGQGEEILKSAGIEVSEYQGSLKNKLEDTCEEFLWNFRQKKIFVALKVAQSLDGQIALSSGESQWITGPDSRLKVHELRAQYDAVLVGKNTVLVDNPSLNIRHPEIKKENKVVILDRTGEVLKRAQDLKIFKSHKPENIFVVTQKNANVRSDQAQILECDKLEEALEVLYSKGLRSVMVEGGGQVFGEFVQKSLVQRFHVFTAPILLGQGRRWTSSMTLKSMSEKIQIHQGHGQALGQDYYFTGRV